MADLLGDGLGDFRISAASRLAQDLPAAFGGGPEHKAGAGVYLTSLVQTEHGEYVSFITPSAAAMALKLALKARDAAAELQTVLTFRPTLTPHGSGKSVPLEQAEQLFDFFEQCLVCATFSFQALEVYCNHTIARTLKHNLEVKIRDKRHVLSPLELERRLSTEDKLCQVLPEIMNVTTPKGKRPWEAFMKLKDARDAAVHLKHDDQRTVDKESLFFQFLSGRYLRYPEASIEMIRWFVSGNEPRWLASITRSEGAAGQGGTSQHLESR